MDGNPLFKIVLGCALMYVLWGLVPNLIQYTSLLSQTTRASHAIIAAEQNPVGASDLRDQLVTVNAFGLVARTGADLRCATSAGQWHFTCTFMPTPRASITRVQFGVTLDGLSRFVEVSQLVPVDAPLPAPQKAVPARMIK